jgi:hypothetical protein
MDDQINSEIIKLDYNFKKLSLDLNILKKRSESSIDLIIKDNQNFESKYSSDKLQIDNNISEIRRDIDETKTSLDDQLRQINLRLDQKADKFSFTKEFALNNPEIIIGSVLILQILLIK